MNDLLPKEADDVALPIYPAVIIINGIDNASERNHHALAEESSWDHPANDNDDGSDDNQCNENDDNNTGEVLPKIWTLSVFSEIE